MAIPTKVPVQRN